MAVDPRRRYQKFSRPADGTQARQQEETESHVNRLWQAIEALQGDTVKQIQQVNSQMVAAVGGISTFQMPGYDVIASNLYPFMDTHNDARYLRLDCKNDPLTADLTIQSGVTVYAGYLDPVFWGMRIFVTSDYRGDFLYVTDVDDNTYFRIRMSGMEYYANSPAQLISSFTNTNSLGSTYFSVGNETGSLLNWFVIGGGVVGTYESTGIPNANLTAIRTLSSSGLIFESYYVGAPIVFVTRSGDYSEISAMIDPDNLTLNIPLRYNNSGIYGSLDWTPTTADKSIIFPDASGTVALTSDLADYEPALGNPAVDGYILSSTAAGVRSWIEMSAGLSGSGTAGTIVKFASASSVGDSIITESAGTIVIGGLLTVTTGVLVDYIGELTSSHGVQFDHIIKTSNKILLTDDVSDSILAGLSLQLRGDAAADVAMGLLTDGNVNPTLYFGSADASHLMAFTWDYVSYRLSIVNPNTAAVCAGFYPDGSMDCLLTIRPYGGYLSADGTAGETATVDLTSATSLTVKNGLITGHA
jgi:hypothetical protein